MTAQHSTVMAIDLSLEWPSLKSLQQQQEFFLGMKYDVMETGDNELAVICNL